MGSTRRARRRPSGGPFASLRDGVLVYQCASWRACPGGTVHGLSSSHSIPAGSYGLTPARASPRRSAGDRRGPRRCRSTSGSIRLRPSPATIPATSRSLGSRRRSTTGSAPTSAASTSARGGPEPVRAPQLPGRRQSSRPRSSRAAVESVTAGKNWGPAVGHDATLSPNMFNTFRYGYTVIDSTNQGLRSGTPPRSASSTARRPDLDVRAQDRHQQPGQRLLVAQGLRTR